MHSYLDDGPAVQFAHYGSFVGWAALELYVVEELLGARLAHSYGGLIPEPYDRAAVGLRARRPRGARLDRHDGLRQHRRLHRATTSATSRCSSSYLLVDIGAQLHRPTGHAINPVPLTEAERIPSARRSSRSS